jgi:riboflavin synthase
MFTGIIKALGKVVKAGKKNEALILEILFPETWGKITNGNSIAINGVCLTVADTWKNTALFFCQKETVDVTNLGHLKKNDRVNLEHAMHLSDELGGHIVQGHVDTTGILKSIEKIGEGWRYWITLPKERPSGIVHKGSIALDGISLTISRLKKNSLSVDIIPFTYENTNIQSWKTGYIINIETDIIGKYVEKYMKAFKK